MFAPSLPHFEFFGRTIVPNEIHVVHLIVDLQFYSIKFNMNIVHNTLQSIQMWQSKWPYYKIVNNMENNLNQESENRS